MNRGLLPEMGKTGSELIWSKGSLLAKSLRCLPDIQVDVDSVLHEVLVTMCTWESRTEYKESVAIP